MIIIDEILVSEEIFTNNFLCNLDACKGACCWEGDAGAPLEEDEIQILKDEFENIKPFLSPAGLKSIEKLGLYTFYKEANEFGTPLIDNGPCAYMLMEPSGKAKCGIEKAFEEGKTTFRKPISCHLYPIRIETKKEKNFQAVNYERWEICNAACQKGDKNQLPVFRFLKEAIIRKFGERFYQSLEHVASELEENESQ